LLRAVDAQCQVGLQVSSADPFRSPRARAAQRIMGVKYSFPSSLHLARECMDLITKIFVANPANRISIGGIRAHPWFLKNLPEELQARPGGRGGARHPPWVASDCCRSSALRENTGTEGGLVLALALSSAVPALSRLAVKIGPLAPACAPLFLGAPGQ